MNILAIAHFYIEHNGAGGEHYLHRLLREIAKRHNVHIWVTDGEKSPDTTIDGVKVHYHKKPLVTPDIVLTHFAANSPKAREIAAQYGTPIVCLVHNEDPITKHDISLYTPDDLVIFNTDWIKKETPTSARTIVLHPPVNKDDFATTPGDHITLVNLTPEKGSETFYQLASLLPEEKFLGVTGGYFPDKFDHRTMPNVKIIPQTHNMKDDVYAKSKIVLMPSSKETYGMVAAEAICSGIPVIAHPTAGLRENLGKAGIYVNRKDYKGWVDMIQFLNVKANYENRQAIIREHVETKNPAVELARAVKAIEALKEKTMHEVAPIKQEDGTETVTLYGTTVDVTGKKEFTLFKRNYKIVRPRAKRKTKPSKKTKGNE